MEGVQKKMDVHMTMGNEQNLQFLTDMSTVITSNPDLVCYFFILRFKLLPMSRSLMKIWERTLSSCFISMSSRERKSKPRSTLNRH
jgi:hypothetical protein